MVHKSSITLKSIWNLSWPIIVANLTIPIVTATDTALMGQQIESKYMAGVALGGIVFNFLYISFNFLRMGTTGLTSQAFGSLNFKKVEIITLSSITIALILGGLILIFSSQIIWISKLFLKGSSGSEILMGQYIAIRIFDAPATLINMSLLGAFFGIGAPKPAMIQLIFISILNAILSIVFIFLLDWGIEGVAFASVLAQWLGMILSFFLFLNVLNIKIFNFISNFQNENFWNRKQFLLIFNISKDILLRTLCLAIAHAILLNNSAKLGDNYLAATQINLVFVGFIAYGLDGFAHASETLIGQAIGRKDLISIKSAMTNSLILALVLATIMSIFLFIFGFALIKMITSIQDVIIISTELLPFLVLLPLVSVWAYMFDGFFIGAAESKSMRDTTLAALIFFIAINYFFIPLDGSIKFLWFGFLIFLFLRGIFLFFHLNKIFNKVHDNI